MPCVAVAGAIVCMPTGFHFRKVRPCPTEGKVRRFVVRREVWYASTLYCCGCGDQWDAGEGRYPRPFRRGWRKQRIAEHRTMWEAAGPVTAAETAWRAHLEAELAWMNPRRGGIVTARPVVRRNGTVWIGDREIGSVERVRPVWIAWRGAGWFRTAPTRRFAVAALVRADEGTTDADPR